MQFISNGPDVPDLLLQLHEEGRVVFFCGAGISCSAGLPNFCKLVKKLICCLGAEDDPMVSALLRNKQYDAAINLLEQDYKRSIVREKIAAILAPTLTPKPTPLHEALLFLGKTRNQTGSSKFKLITTNFDRLFEEMIKQKSLDIKRFEAPLLPIPNNSWDGLVYLHGLLADPLTLEPLTKLNHLVVSSGDFGLAYLTEGWAARFMSEVYRKYTICFVGYSLNDPVMRYMTDAIAADKLRGENRHELFAFDSYSKGKKEEQDRQWQAKSVTPILYKKHNNHEYLYKTLMSWARTYQDGVGGKERIIIENAIFPTQSTIEDNFIQRVLWALRDSSGLPAKCFAELDPLPPLEWLKWLAKESYQTKDLSSFGLAEDPNFKRSFSFINRPASYTDAPRMSLVDTDVMSWDKVMEQLAAWLIRHINDPELLVWIAKQGGQLHQRFIYLIEEQLQKNHKNQIESCPGEEPKKPLLTILWRLLLSSRIKPSFLSPPRGLDLAQWEKQFKREGLTPSLRIKLRELLRPCIKLIPFLPLGNKPTSDKNIRSHLTWKIELWSDTFHHTLKRIQDEVTWKQALPTLLSDFNGLLQDTLDLIHELNGNESFAAQLPLSSGKQNWEAHEWTVLVDLTRDAWLALVQESPMKAHLTAQLWQQNTHVLFKRLALFAATHEAVIPLEEGLSWLLADNRLCLWAGGTEQETIELLKFLAPKLKSEKLNELEQAILNGPPQEEAQETPAVDYEIWLRLAHMQQASASLSIIAQERLRTLSLQNPDWKHKFDKRNENSILRSGSSDTRVFHQTPIEQQDLVTWLKEHPTKNSGVERDDWQKRCQTHSSECIDALCTLHQEEIWPEIRWKEALQVWTKPDFLEVSWNKLASCLEKAPTDFLISIADNLSSWLQEIAKVFSTQHDLFFKICKKILEFYKVEDPESQTEDTISVEDAVHQAINHPVGKITFSLLNSWFEKTPPHDNDGLPLELKILFTKLCNSFFTNYRNGRVILAGHVITLFRVDTEWTKKHLLPHFNWQTNVTEARDLWQGFIWGARLYSPLLECIKQPFLETAQHYEKLGKAGPLYVNLLTVAALEQTSPFSDKDFRVVTRVLPKESLYFASHTLVLCLRSAREQSEEYFRKHIMRYWENIWPKELARLTDKIIQNLAELCVYSDKAFPEALKLFKSYLEPVKNVDHIVTELSKLELANIFPKEVLTFLSIIVEENNVWLPAPLKSCLEKISQSRRDLITDDLYKKLEKISKIR